MPINDVLKIATIRDGVSCDPEPILNGIGEHIKIAWMFSPAHLQTSIVTAIHALGREHAIYGAEQPRLLAIYKMVDRRNSKVEMFCVSNSVALIGDPKQESLFTSLACPDSFVRLNIQRALYVIKIQFQSVIVHDFNCEKKCKFPISVEINNLSQNDSIYVYMLKSSQHYNTILWHGKTKCLRGEKVKPDSFVVFEISGLVKCPGVFKIDGFYIGDQREISFGEFQSCHLVDIRNEIVAIQDT